jgi:hypothetical protein
VRGLHKMPDEKRADVLRSLYPLLEAMEPHWDGQMDMLEYAAEQQDAHVPEAVDDEVVPFDADETEMPF